MIEELFAGVPMRFGEAITLTERGEMKPFAMGTTVRLRQQMIHRDMQSRTSWVS